VIITTRSKPKEFTWSYSRLKNFETCPERHYHLDIIKDIKEPEGENLQWGNAVHKALAKRLSNGTPLSKTMEGYEHWCTKIIGDGSFRILVEQKLAITRQFGPCDYFGSNVWCRAIADVIKISSSGRVALVADWKTGKIIEDSQQLAINAACIFAHYPEVQIVRSEFIWLKEEATSREDFDRGTIVKAWNVILPRVNLLEQASISSSYPPKKGGLCKTYCPVKQCQYNGQ